MIISRFKPVVKDQNIIVVSEKVLDLDVRRKTLDRKVTCEDRSWPKLHEMNKIEL